MPPFDLTWTSATFAIIGVNQSRITNWTPWRIAGLDGVLPAGKYTRTSRYLYLETTLRGGVQRSSWKRAIRGKANPQLMPQGGAGNAADGPRGGQGGTAVTEYRSARHRPLRNLDPRRAGDDGPADLSRSWVRESSRQIPIQRRIVVSRARSASPPVLSGSCSRSFARGQR